MNVIDASCFDECFLSCVITERLYSFLKPCRSFEIFSTAILLFFFGASVLKEVRILHYLHNNNTVLIPNFQNIATAYYTYLHLINFCGWLIWWWRFLYSVIFWVFYYTFFYKWSFWKTQNESMLLRKRIFINSFHKTNFYKVRTKLHNKIT